ncbi:MAG TPA: hypothetical protein VFX28_16380 [Methylomirabilota bacterium]|nr:hypothetical protein [Methylomirabilota bacterium]
MFVHPIGRRFAAAVALLLPLAASAEPAPGREGAAVEKSVRAMLSP